MKLKLSRLISLSAATGILLFLLSPGKAPAQATIEFNPGTGQPAAADQWIAPDWTDPDIILTNVEYDTLPAAEVAKQLLRQFKNSFDIIISPGHNFLGNSLNLDPGSESIKLELKDVHASELFRAMNLLFETENSPMRWKLMMNGTRRLVLLQVIPALLPQAEHQMDPGKISVYYVGDLMGDGGMTLKQIADTLQDVNNQGYGGSISIGFHNETQLVIVKGTPDQVALINSTLGALKENLAYTRYKASRPMSPIAPPGNSRP
jgi:hypothetical protein